MGCIWGQGEGGSRADQLRATAEEKRGVAPRVWPGRWEAGLALGTCDAAEDFIAAGACRVSPVAVPVFVTRVSAGVADTGI